MNLLNAIKTVRLFKEKEKLIPLQTQWGERLDIHNILSEYPRPQMQRESYYNLNGIWNYAFTKEKTFPSQMNDQIVVPFSPESQLSQVGRQLQPDEYLWYERPLPSFQNMNGHCLLHFGAVDQIADIYMNHQKVAHHVGGYLPFSIDITDFITNNNNILTVRVQDTSDTSYHSKGKQRLKRGGMYYTAQSGIWQTVWLEWVPETYIEDILLVADYDQQSIQMKITFNQDYYQDIHIQIDEEDILTFPCHGITFQKDIKINQMKPWTPDSPYLYSIKIKTTLDKIESYFAMRIYTIEKDQQQIPRICLNHETIFMNGVLDQGYWPDGLYTAPSDEALIYDIKMMKSLGMNMIRKHIKIESARWYYHCDHLGMIVWQDMVNGGSPYHTWFITWMPSIISWTKKHISDKHLRLLARKDKKGQDEFINECQMTIQHLSHFPCISTWVLFNEGWGQFRTAQLTKMIHQLDPTRLVDSASGWFDQGCGDFRSEHHYFDKPKMIPDHRAFVLSEYGGYTCQVKNHISIKKAYGYGTYETIEDFSKAYNDLFFETVQPLIKEGLCGAVYTQVSDIEEEVNGLLTYDRKVCKIKRIS